MEKKAYIKMEILNAIDAMNQEMEKSANLAKALGAVRSGYKGLVTGLQSSRAARGASKAWGSAASGASKAWGSARSGYRGLKAGLEGTRVSTRASNAAKKGQAVGKHLRDNKNVYFAGGGGTVGGVAAGAGGLAAINKANEPDTIRERLAAAYEALIG